VAYADFKKRAVDDPEQEFKDQVINIRRVTKVVKGGKNLSFSALVAVGNGRGTVGIGKGKAREVPMAIAKAVQDAKKKLITVPLKETTIPHLIRGVHGGPPPRGRALSRAAPSASSWSWPGSRTS